jgi:hypothetical protein
MTPTSCISASLRIWKNVSVDIRLEMEAGPEAVGHGDLFITSNTRPKPKLGVENGN